MHVQTTAEREGVRFSFCVSDTLPGTVIRAKYNAPYSEIKDRLGVIVNKAFENSTKNSEKGTRFYLVEFPNRIRYILRTFEFSNVLHAESQEFLRKNPWVQAIAEPEA